MIDFIAGIAQPWADLYGGSVPVEVTVVFLHLAALMVAGGLAIASDRAIFRASPAGADVKALVVQVVGGAHRLVLIGLGVLVVTGLLMLLADVEALLTSPLFWAKMVGFGLLLVNGARLRRLAAGNPVADAAAWRPLYGAAVTSTALWLGLLLLGVLLPLVA